MVKFATRRVATDKTTGLPRHPCSLDGVSTEDFSQLRLDRVLLAAAAVAGRASRRRRRALRAGDGTFGPSSATDLVFGEVNFAELPRYVPIENQPRKRFVFAEVSTPAKLLIFDALVHRDLGRRRRADIYDTAFDGIANVNDPARDIDRMDLAETVQSLGEGMARAGPRRSRGTRHCWKRRARNLIGAAMSSSAGAPGSTIRSTGARL